VHIKRKIKTDTKRGKFCTFLEKIPKNMLKKAIFLKNIEIAYWQQKQKCITIEMN